jgi:DNA-binding CsgD family transcriptional regulator
VSKPVPEILTKAQKKIFDLMVVGMATKTIAKRLKLSPHTVHDQIRKILHAYGVHSRVELMAILINSKVPGVDRNE